MLTKGLSLDRSLIEDSNLSIYVKKMTSIPDRNLTNIYDMVLMRNIDGWGIYKLSDKKSVIQQDNTDGVLALNLLDYLVINQLEVLSDNYYKTTGDDSYIYFELNRFITPDYCIVEFELIPEDMDVELLYTHGESYWDDYGEIKFRVFANGEKKYILKFDNNTSDINRIRLSFRNMPHKSIMIKNITIGLK